MKDYKDLCKNAKEAYMGGACNPRALFRVIVSGIDVIKCDNRTDAVFAGRLSQLREFASIAVIMCDAECETLNHNTMEWLPVSKAMAGFLNHRLNVGDLGEKILVAPLRLIVAQLVYLSREGVGTYDALVTDLKFVETNIGE